VRIPVQSDALKPSRGATVALAWAAANALVY